MNNYFSLTIEEQSKFYKTDLGNSRYKHLTIIFSNTRQ